MSIKGKAFIVGAYEHPDRVIPDKSVSQIQAEVAIGALKDAGLSLSDVDGYFYTGQLNLGGTATSDYFGLTNLKCLDTTMTGGSSPMFQIGHAAAAIAGGKCRIALVTLAARPRSERASRAQGQNPESAFEQVYGTNTVSMYALAAMRHMYEFGTTSEQLAWVKVASSEHSQYNPHAFLQKVVT